MWGGRSGWRTWSNSAARRLDSSTKARYVHDPSPISRPTPSSSPRRRRRSAAVFTVAPG